MSIKFYISHNYIKIFYTNSNGLIISTVQSHSNYIIPEEYNFENKNNLDFNSTVFSSIFSEYIFKYIFLSLEI